MPVRIWLGAQMIPVKHKKCGQTAFYLKKKLELGDTLYVNNIVYSDRKAQSNTLLVCQHCDYTGNLILKNNRIYFS